jgi:glycosyltransferase involved in cell wall biosynthesis
VLSAVLISVVIPVRNRLVLLDRALQSLRRQCDREFEVIIVDDGSEEEILPVAARFPDLTIELLRCDRPGANRARNIGSDAARGRFVAYLDADDLFLPEKLMRLVPRLEAQDPDILISAGYVWRGGDRLQVKPRRPIGLKEDISEFYFLHGERFITSAFIVKTQLAREIRWDEALRKVQDPDFIIRLVRAGHCIDYVAEPLVVLCDDVQIGRISNTNHVDNMRDWLARSGELLSSRARVGFELYVLAYELSRVSMAQGVGLALKTALWGRPPARLLAKTLCRIAVPLAVFKLVAQVRLLFERRSRTPAVGLFIESMATSAKPPVRRAWSPRTADCGAIQSTPTLTPPFPEKRR